LQHLEIGPLTILKSVRCELQSAPMLTLAGVFPNHRKTSLEIRSAKQATESAGCSLGGKPLHADLEEYARSGGQLYIAASANGNLKAAVVFWYVDYGMLADVLVQIRRDSWKFSRSVVRAHWLEGHIESIGYGSHGGEDGGRCHTVP
jgi:hypothetical protein